MATKAQLALLTNPLVVSQFGLNLDLFYQIDDASGDTEEITPYGMAVEGLNILPQPNPRSARGDTCPPPRTFTPSQAE